MSKTKQCAKCGETKPLNDFHKNKHNPSGVQTNCKECTNEYMRQRRRTHAAPTSRPKAVPRVKQLHEVFALAEVLVESGTSDIPDAIQTALQMVAKGVTLSR